MISTKLSAIVLAVGLGAASGGEQAAGPTTAAQPGPVKPWVKTKDMECDWWLSREDGHSLRVAIGYSSDGIVLTFGDLVFNTWSEADEKVELRFNGDDRRRVKTSGWATHSDGFGLFGLFLTADAIQKMGGATKMELIHQGKAVVTLPLAETPSTAELKECVPPPSNGPSDSE